MSNSKEQFVVVFVSGLPLLRRSFSHRESGGDSFSLGVREGRMACSERLRGVSRGAQVPLVTEVLPSMGGSEDMNYC